MLKHTVRRDASWSEKSVTQKGFTLIELLVVIIILGILAGVVIFAVGKTQDNAKKATCKTEYNTVRSALRAYGSDDTPNLPAPTLTILASDGYLDVPTTGLKYVNGISGSGTAASPYLPTLNNAPNGCP